MLLDPKLQRLAPRSDLLAERISLLGDDRAANIATNLLEGDATRANFWASTRVVDIGIIALRSLIFAAYRQSPGYNHGMMTKCAEKLLRDLELAHPGQVCIDSTGVAPKFGQLPQLFFSCVK